MLTKYIFVTSLLLTLCSCASIVSKSDYPVSIMSEPENAHFKIINKDEKVIHSGRTPSTVTLHAGGGYFKKAEYIIEFEKTGYEPKVSSITPKVDGWYVSNIIFGGLLGLLFIDPITGAMYKIENEHSVLLDKEVID